MKGATTALTLKGGNAPAWLVLTSEHYATVSPSTMPASEPDPAKAAAKAEARQRRAEERAAAYEAALAERRRRTAEAKAATLQTKEERSRRKQAERKTAKERKDICAQNMRAARLARWANHVHVPDHDKRSTDIIAPKGYLSCTNAAIHAGCSPATLSKACKLGQVEHVRQGRYVFIRPEEAERYISRTPAAWRKSISDGKRRAAARGAEA